METKPHLEPITKDPLDSVHCAQQEYYPYLESEKRKKELEAQKLIEEVEREETHSYSRKEKASNIGRRKGS
ncbi:hypothetical protein PR048_012214 [Dryococelus australis]|uniref:Uncharacterized protein n=1 Tax=Dryococelus australis TaxID=614101 RepID=A0ABQ9HNS7_9NEOP|nr:hypothetical protein PR048_012214 [Dryococelus australis]